MKSFTEQENQLITEDDKIIQSYYKRGFLKSKQDEEDLHMAYSPYRVPKGLTGLQIRRKINKFIKNGRKSPSYDLTFNRLEVTINGKLRLGATFTGQVPVTKQQFRKLLKSVM